MERKRRKFWFGMVSVGLLAALVIWLGQWGKGQRPQQVGQGGLTSAETNSVGTRPNVGLEEQMRSLSKDLGAATNTAGRVDLLRDLRGTLSAMTTNEASAVIRRFLDSKSDAPTGQGFKIQNGGTLAEAPTLRTYLLDYLGQIDPAAAAAYAKVILSGSDSPDEWAVALRSLAVGDNSAEGRALLAEKTRDLLRREDWQQNPSTGYLEAFDVAVYLGGANLAPVLGELVRKQDNQAVAHAAFLALDRMVINEPGAMLSALEADPALMQGREQTRADYFGRADVRDPLQRQVLESYLLDPHIGPRELDHFAGVFPNANFMISANLLTSTPTPGRSDLTGRDAESLRVVNEWLSDARFATLRPQLEKTKTRLEEFVRQASGK